MKKNVGSADKAVRILIGVILLAIGLLAQLSTGWRIGLIAVAAVALITAFTGL